MILFVTGTGTGIGKTHLSEALLLRAGRERSVLGYKPIESGCLPGDATSDHARLAAASSFHVKHLPEYCFGAPVSPHLAAKLEGRPIDLNATAARVHGIAREVEILLVELAGGLYSPLDGRFTNADFLRLVQSQEPATRTLLVAPDRLGVLHDLGATLRAAASEGVIVHGIALSMPATIDPSTGTNGREMNALTAVPVLGTVERAPPSELANAAAVRSICSILLGIS